MSTTRKVLAYGATIGLVAMTSMWWEGKPVEPARLLWLALILPLFGFAIWLRWDWRPGEGRRLYKDREKRRAEWLRSRQEGGE